MFSIKTKVLPRWLMPKRRQSMRWTGMRIFITHGKSFMNDYRKKLNKRHSDRFWDDTIPNPEG